MSTTTDSISQVPEWLASLVRLMANVRLAQHLDPDAHAAELARAALDLAFSDPSAAARLPDLAGEWEAHADALEVIARREIEDGLWGAIVAQLGASA